MPCITERGLKIKANLLQKGRKQNDLIAEVRKTYVSFDSRALYDLLYTDRKSKYESIVFDTLALL